MLLTRVRRNLALFVGSLCAAFGGPCFLIAVFGTDMKRQFNMTQEEGEWAKRIGGLLIHSTTGSVPETVAAVPKYLLFGLTQAPRKLQV